MTIERFGKPKEGGKPFSKAVKAGGFLFVSGQVPKDANGLIVHGTMVTQARVALDNLKSVLELAGYSLNDVVKVDVWVDDPRDFADFNKVYAEYFTTEHAPARNTVQSSLMSDIRVELACTAYKA